MTQPADDDRGSVAALALSKMTRVLGGQRAVQLHAAVLAECNLPHLATAADLAVFAEALSRRPGFEGTLGTMLAVDAICLGVKRA